jgi:hypothetical protein
MRFLVGVTKIAQLRMFTVGPQGHTNGEYKVEIRDEALFLLPLVGGVPRAHRAWLEKALL